MRVRITRTTDREGIKRPCVEANQADDGSWVDDIGSMNGLHSFAELHGDLLISAESGPDYELTIEICDGKHD